MYYGRNTYPYPYYVNAPINNSDFMPRNDQGMNQQVFEAILVGLEREASAIDFYSRLANVAPNQKNKNDILQVAEDKKVHLQKFKELYITLTGKQPEYQINKVTFQTYRGGLQKAYETEVEAYEEYRNGCLSIQHSLVRDVFLRVLAKEKEHATRFGYLNEGEVIEITDYGAEPFVVNIEEATKQNNNYRTALWTGSHLQVTLMSIDVGGDIGLETHPTLDQFIRIEEGHGLVQMGDSKDNLDFEERAYDGYAIIIPAGKWHNLTNTGDKPIKLYSIYAPPEHPFGTVHETKEIAMGAENHDY